MMQMTQSIEPTEIPSWMIQSHSEPEPEPEPQPQPLALHPSDEGKSPAQIKKELRETQFRVFFETVLVKLEQGMLLTDIVKDDRRGFEYDGLLRWIMSDPERKTRYYEAQEIGTELIVDEAVKIADGDGLEDVQRSKLRIDTRLWAVKARNRKRFGDVKTLEVNQSISITAALEQANQRLVKGITIDHEEIE